MKFYLGGIVGLFLMFLLGIPFLAAIGSGFTRPNDAALAGVNHLGGPSWDGTGARFAPGDPFGAPCKVFMAQAYGNTPYEHPHHGIDLVCPYGIPLVSVTPGVVFRTNGGCPYGEWGDTSCGGGYGNYVMLDLPYQEADLHAIHHLYILYAHMKQTPSVQVGQTVEPGTLLGYEGSSGWSSGPHLHFEVDFDRPTTTASTDPSILLQPGLF